MAKSARGRRRFASRQCQVTPYSVFSRKWGVSKNLIQKKRSKVLRKDWEDSTCSVCMEYPHNAVLLLCSSHDKGCRPYMCGTSSRYSNCLDQYKKAYTKAMDTFGPLEKHEVSQLACPLCRGQVKGWTVVEPARTFLNAKKRNCMQEKCSFIGTYKELRGHVKMEHPCARPREVDPGDEQKWRSLERERDREDVISTITSSMPGAMVFGDYVVEGSHYRFDSDEEEEDGFGVGGIERNGAFEMGIDSNLVNVFLLLHAFGSNENAGPRRAMRRHDRDSNRDATPDGDSDEDDGGGNAGISLASRLRRQGTVILGRSRRRRQQRESNGGAVI